MNIAQRIRAIAEQKIKVRITGKKRSRGGFYVWYPVGEHSAPGSKARTKNEALQMLLAKVRCMPEIEFLITVRPPHVGDRQQPETSLRKNGS